MKNVAFVCESVTFSSNDDGNHDLKEMKIFYDQLIMAGYAVFVIDMIGNESLL